MSRDLCAACRFWDGPHGTMEGASMKVGRCRRRAPRMVRAAMIDGEHGKGHVDQGHWPWTLDTDWCGESESVFSGRE